jgi:tetratricopeptide (TPR) repeat protein
MRHGSVQRYGMSAVNLKLVEKYQMMLHKDPRSRVFAPLVDAYRKMGMHKEALVEGLKGVKLHPEFAGGRIALAQVLFEREQFEPAADHLKKAVKLSPENNMAYSLLAETFVRLRQPKQALKTYKMVLFLNPQDQKAAKAVQKLESLTADEFEAEVFQMMPLKSIEEIADATVEPLTPGEKPESEQKTPGRWSDLERSLSLLDAFIVRNEFERAKQVLSEAERYHSNEPELEKRRRILNQVFNDSAEASQPISPKEPDVEPVELEKSTAPLSMPPHTNNKVTLLKSLLARIADRSQDWT